MSTSMALLLVVVFVCLVKFTNCIDLNLVAQEDIELHSNILFDRYNKPVVQETKTIHGDTYSCVDFHKQPAFDHLLSRNYSYHYEMYQESNTASKESSPFNDLWANGEGCPTGTIPVRKYTRKQFIRTHKLFQKLYPPVDPLPGRFRATVHTLDGPQAFYGGSAIMNVYNYPVDPSQYTAGLMIVRAALDQLQFGWIINPAMYGDGQSKLFVTTTVDHKRCFNLMCGGYVHTNKDIPIDTASPRATKRGELNTVEIQTKIIKEGNAWKLYTSQNTLLGYWPIEVLNGLKGPAEYLSWGGEVYNPNDLKGPGMGSGFFPTGQPENDGYARQLTRYAENGEAINVVSDETETFTNFGKLYKAQDGGDVEDDIHRHIMYYGGPGKT